MMIAILALLGVGSLVASYGGWSVQRECNRLNARNAEVIAECEREGRCPPPETMLVHLVQYWW